MRTTVNHTCLPMSIVRDGMVPLEGTLSLRGVSDRESCEWAEGHGY